MKNLIKSIHKTPFKTVIAITGGGSQAIGELLRYGGGGDTILEANVPYDFASIDDMLGGRPDKYCSEATARQMAMWSFMRGVKLNKGNPDKIIGIGTTCSLVKTDGERLGRKHQVFTAFQTEDKTCSFGYEIAPGNYREDEELFASQKIINTLAQACGIDKDLIMDNLRTMGSTTHLASSSKDTQEIVLGKRSLKTTKLNEKDSDFIFAGSFNPIHDGHIGIAKAVKKMYDTRVDFELCVQNTDKFPLNYYDIVSRTNDLTKCIRDGDFGGNIHITSTPTFLAKSFLFPGKTFIVGMDTFLRIGKSSYYTNFEESMNTIEKNNCRFLVFHRMLNGRPSMSEDFESAAPSLRKISTLVSHEMYPVMDISSSGMREKDE